MIIGYIGIPGCGKTSVLTLRAQKELERIRNGKSRYQRVYTSFYCLGCFKLNFQDLGHYYFHHSLIILDEMTLLQDSRDWKNLDQGLKDFITLHRHFDCDILYSCQDWSRCEKTLRENTYLLFYLEKFLLPCFHIVRARRIFRNLNINEYSSELTLGYRFGKFFESLGQQKFYHISKAFKYFNSFEKFGFDSLPEPSATIWQPTARAPNGSGASRLTS